MTYEQWKEPFDRAGKWLVRRYPGILKGKQGQENEARLKVLRTTRNKMTIETYYERKFSGMLLFLFGGLLFLGVLALGFHGEVSWMERPSIKRPGYGEGNLETELTVGFSGEEVVDIPLTIGERKYSREEIQEIFQGILENLEEQILGENKSLEEVRKDLDFADSFGNGTVTAVLSVDPPDYMDDNGHFLCEPPKEGILAAVKLTLKYENQEMIREFPVKLLPPERSELEEKALKLKAAAEKNGEKSREAEEVVLPDRWEGVPVRWGIRENSPLLAGFLILAVGLWYLYGRDDRKLKEEEKHRKQQMILDYPVILYKMSMLLEAGMTIRGAFSKIAFHYRDQSCREVHYAYEEMLFACYEMEQGVGEATAYEEFGQRCGNLHYLKFGSLLSQDLKKGSAGLVELLEQEAENGMEERKSLARKLGEEAGTKLLLPMMLMLILVVVILMVPAVLAF